MLGAVEIHYHNLGFLQYAQLFMTYMTRLIKLYTFWPLYILLQSNKTLTMYMNLLRAGSSLHTETFVWILWAYEKCQLATIKIGHLGCSSASRNTSSTKPHAHCDANRCRSRPAMTAREKEVRNWSQILLDRKADKRHSFRKHSEKGSWGSFRSDVLCPLA